MSNSKVLDKVEADIEKHGWHVLSVLGGDLPNFSYTIGFTETLNHPEILMSGLSTKLMHQLLNDIGKLIEKGNSFNSGDTCDEVIKGYMVKFLTVDNSNINEYFRAANSHYGDCNFEALQCVWPDQYGDFPSKTVNNQEVLA